MLKCLWAFVVEFAEDARKKKKPFLIYFLNVDLQLKWLTFFLRNAARLNMNRCRQLISCLEIRRVWISPYGIFGEPYCFGIIGSIGTWRSSLRVLKFTLPDRLCSKAKEAPDRYLDGSTLTALLYRDLLNDRNGTLTSLCTIF
ncbi:hypothetical protein GOP47_0029532 [Adiantum capillus-veneris]|nr:hypothetical protein GOP47_0029532 [Adiantum capillus-veneris]